jgi:hypothetical protein
MQGSEMPEIKAVILQDNEGVRLFAKYYNKEDFSDKLTQIEFEKRLVKKVRSSNARMDTEIALLEGYTVAFKLGTDVTLAIVGSGDENELILVAVIDSLFESITALLRGAIDKKNVLASLELVLLAVDETIDGGIILELDSTAVEARVMLKGAVPDSISSYKEMTIGTVVEKLRDRTAKQFAKN